MAHSSPIDQPQTSESESTTAAETRKPARSEINAGRGPTSSASFHVWTAIGTTIATATLVVAIVQLQIGNVQSQIENVQAQIGNVQAQIGNAESQITGLRGYVQNQFNSVGTTLESVRRDGHEDIGNVQSQITDLRGYVQNQFNSVGTTLESVRSDGREDIRSVDAKIDALSEKVSSFGERMVKVETSLDTLLAGRLPAASGGEASTLTGAEFRSNN